MLLTKLHIPPTGNNIVHRSELYEKLDIGLNRKLILVSAPAGFGKSTLLGDWINQRKISTAWFSIDNGDNDPVEFLSYIISGIQNIDKEFGQSALNLLKLPVEPNLISISGLLINDILRIDRDFLLVLDDFHLISNNEILKLISFLLERIPDNIHIVISTRSDPALPLARLRSQQQMIELRSIDLVFSTNDISELFNKKFKCRLSIDDICSLETKTEGWIAGLQLMALSVQGRNDISGFIGNLKGDNRYIMDYLMEEVLKLQSDDVREFLIQTSALGQMSGNLCNMVLNKSDSSLILEKLDKNNMFIVSLDNERQWYRYHHLFGDLLRQRFGQKDPLLIIEINTKACDWFEQNNMHDLAIEHALEIKNYEKSIQLLDKVVERMWENGQHAAIMNYGDILPVELIKKNPEFCLYYSWILITAGQIQKADPFLSSAEKLTIQILENKNSSKEDIQYYKKLHGKIAVAFAYLNSHLEHSGKIFEYCKTAIENLTNDDLLWYSWAWFSYGIAYYSDGKFVESNNAFQRAFEYGKKSGNIYLISTIVIRMAENEQQLGHYKSAYEKCSELLALIKEKGYSHITKADWTYAALYFTMGITEFMWADLDRAYENIKIAYELSKNGKDVFLKIFILMVYSYILNENGDAEAEKRINEVHELVKHNDIPPFFKSYYIGWKIFFYMDKNQINLANQVVFDYGLDLGKEKTHVNESAYSSYARLLIAQNKFDDAELLLSELYALAIADKRIEKIIDLKTSFAMLYKMKGEYEKAIDSLIEAMEFAAEEELLTYFVFNTYKIEDLLNDIINSNTIKKNKIPKKFIEKLRLARQNKEKFKKANNEFEISSRELDTLKLITLELSNQEIADKLFISLNTVKTHLKNIYLKLNVDSRTKAVSKAKELGII